ncbi:MAG: phytoene desaturase family protein, partial [Burkholderiales bacterium]
MTLQMNASAVGNSPRHTDAKAPVALVIGSGFGGLAAAIRLSAKGWRVQVLEKMNTPGGRARVFRKDGYTFDAGPTIITVPFLLEELWALAGRRMADDIELRQLDPFYRVRFADGDHFDYSGDPVKMRNEILRMDPDAGRGYDAFLKEADICFELGFENLGAHAFDSISDMLMALPSMSRMKGWRTLYALVAKHIKHPKLQQVLSLQSLLIGGNPFSVTCVYSLINALERRYGVHWAMGGTGVLVNGLVSLIEEMGGSVKTNAQVQRIDIKNGKACGVTLLSGETIYADVVVSNAD